MSNATNKVEVTLAKPHKHAGAQCQAGDKIMVDAVTAKWLADHQLIVTPPAAKEGAK